MAGVKCTLCGAELTPREVMLIAEAEEVSVEDIVEGKVILSELLCDKCADGTP